MDIHKMVSNWESKNSSGSIGFLCRSSELEEVKEQLKDLYEITAHDLGVAYEVVITPKPITLD